MSAVDRELLDAAHKGDVEAVKAALAKGADWRYTISGGVVRPVGGTQVSGHGQALTQGPSPFPADFQGG
jgi:hypothetical protein